MNFLIFYYELQISLSDFPGTLNDLIRYSHIFKILPSERLVAKSLVATIEKFGWTKVSLITQEIPEYLEVSYIMNDITVEPSYMRTL